MSDEQWFSKNELVKLLGKSDRTVQRRISELEDGPNSHYVRRDENKVLVSGKALAEGLLGETVARLGEQVEILEMTTATLSQDNERLRTETELAVLRAENADLRRQLEAAEAQRDSALDALRMMATRPGVES